MKNSKSSLQLYITYKYFFAYLIVLMVFGVGKTFIGEVDSNSIDIKDFEGLLILIIVFLILQIIAYRHVFRATVSKELIKLNNGQTITWDNVKFLRRFHHLYIIKTKDRNRYYLFPTERQPIRLFGDRIEYTDMDQIINLKRAD